MRLFGHRGEGEQLPLPEAILYLGHAGKCPAVVHGQPSGAPHLDELAHMQKNQKKQEMKLTNSVHITLDSEPMTSKCLCFCTQNLPSGASSVGSLKLTYISKVNLMQRPVNHTRTHTHTHGLVGCTDTPGYTKIAVTRS